MSRRRRQQLTLAIVVLVAIGTGVWYLMQGSREREARIARIEGDYAIERGREKAGDRQYSPIVARIRKEPEFEKEPRLVRILARILHERGDDLEAWDVFGGFADELSDPLPEDASLGADILIRLHAAKGGNEYARRARVLLQLVIEADTEEELEARALFRSWQCSFRLMQEEARKASAEQLGLDHGGTREERVVQVVEKSLADPKSVPDSDLLDLARRWSPEAPVELLLVRVSVAITAGELDPAIAQLEEITRRAPAIVPVRYTAMIAYGMWLNQAAQDDPRLEERRRKLESELRWLAQNHPDAAKRREFEQSLAQLRGQ